MTTDDLQALRAAAAELQRIKQQNRDRATRYLDRRKEAGKRQISAILHNDAYEEINKRRDRSIIEDAPLTAGDIIEQALFATKDFIKLDGTIDIDLISDMAKVYDEYLYCISVNTSVDISDNTKCDNAEHIFTEADSGLEIKASLDNSIEIDAPQIVVIKSTDQESVQPIDVNIDDNIKGETNSEIEEEIKSDTDMFEGGVIDYDPNIAEIGSTDNMQCDNADIITKTDFDIGIVTYIDVDINDNTKTEIEDIFRTSLALMPPVGDKKYTIWVKQIIKQLVALEGLTNKEIKALLEKHKIQTSKGLDSWAIGTVGKYVAEAKRDKD